MTTARDYARGVNPHHPAAFPSTRAQLTGLQPYSGSHMWEPYIIFEVGHDKVTQQAFKSWALDQEVGFRELVGSYRGQVAASFIINARSFPEVLRRGWCDREESVLYLEACYAPASGKSYTKRRASLLYGRGNREDYKDLWLITEIDPEYQAEGVREFIGDWHEVGREQAMRHDGWTFDPSTGKYYVCS